MRKAEREHYDRLFKENSHNVKKCWSILKEVINKRKTRKRTSTFNINNEMVNDDKKIVEHLNDFFVDIGHNLSETIPRANNNYQHYLQANNNSSIFLSPVTCQEVYNTMFSLQNKCPGWDNITAKVVKESHLVIGEVLKYIINLSLSQGIFPNELKIASVIPLHKGGDETLMNNYRPVSILPVFSKIFERIMYKRLVSFLEKHNILYEFQFGFRSGYGTNLALITLIDKIVNSLERGNVVLGLFLDFSKAFDTVNHSILLGKLHAYGIRGIANQWFEGLVGHSL